MASGSKDLEACRALLKPGWESTEEVVCILDHPELVSSDAFDPIRDGHLLGLGGPPRPDTKGGAHIHRQPDGSEVAVMWPATDLSTMGTRIWVQVQGQGVRTVDVPGGYAFSGADVAVTRTHLAVVDLGHEDYDRVLLFDHTRGSLVATLQLEHQARGLHVSNGVLVVRTARGLELFSTTGERLWSVDAGDMQWVQASSDGTALLHHGTKLYLRDVPGRIDLPAPAVLHGTELVSLTKKGTLWRGPVSAWEQMPPGPKQPGHRLRLGVGGDWGVYDGEVVPEGARPVRRGQAWSPVLDPREGTRTVTVAVDAPTVAVLLRKKQESVLIDEEGLDDLGLAIARTITRSLRVVAQQSLEAGQTWDQEVAADVTYEVVAEHDTLKLSPGSSAVKKTLSPQRGTEYRRQSPAGTTVLSVVDGDGMPVPGARLHSLGGGLRVVGRDGTLEIAAFPSEDGLPVRWAISEQGMSTPGRVDRFELDLPRPRCRVVDVEGTVHFEGWCDQVDLPGIRDVGMLLGSLQRLGEDLWQVDLAPTVRLRSPLPWERYDAAWVEDQEGNRVDVDVYFIKGVAPGSARLLLEKDGRRWCTDFEVQPLFTEVPFDPRPCEP